MKLYVKSHVRKKDEKVALGDLLSILYKIILYLFLIQDSTKSLNET